MILSWPVALILVVPATDDEPPGTTRKISLPAPPVITSAAAVPVMISVKAPVPPLIVMPMLKPDISITSAASLVPFATTAAAPATREASPR